MNIQNIDNTKIKIENPKEINDSYEFQINYDGEPFEFITSDRVILREYENERTTLSVTNKLDLKLLYRIYNSFIQNVFDNQSNWFEGEFDMITLKKSFEEYLTINIEENCANILCMCECGDKLDLDFRELVPLFSIDKLIFQDGTFTIRLVLKSFEKYMNEKVESIPQVIQEETKTEIPNEDENEINDEDVKSSDFYTETNNEDDISEIDIETNNLEDTEMTINEEDFYLFYKTIQGNIYNNFSEKLHSVFREKDIRTNDIDLAEVIWDSDDSDINDEDTEISESDNFDDQE